MVESQRYKKQSSFEGSVRQVRGLIIRSLTSGEVMIGTLKKQLGSDRRFDEALEGLIIDKLVTRRAKNCI